MEAGAAAVVADTPGEAGARQAVAGALQVEAVVDATIERPSEICLAAFTTVGMVVPVVQPVIIPVEAEATHPTVVMVRAARVPVHGAQGMCHTPVRIPPTSAESILVLHLSVRRVTPQSSPIT